MKKYYAVLWGTNPAEVIEVYDTKEDAEDDAEGMNNVYEEDFGENFERFYVEEITKEEVNELLD